MTSDLSGRVIKTYELQERIGEGGFGAVYRAHQQLIGREVAIKIILPQHANRPEFIRRFETEAQLVARLEHPHIVPLYDYWREPSGAYLVMRWLRGGSIQDMLERDGKIDLKTTSKILNQLCEALLVAHRTNVIHRDLKPENILMDENGNAYLSDFGIAKDLIQKQNITQDNAILGSPAYLSPEQIRGDAVTPQSDIYAMGVLTYEMVSGSPPFEESSPATLMYKHLSEPLPDITRIAPDLPESVNLVLQRATAKDPADRYEDAIEFAREFRRAVKAEDLYTGPASPKGVTLAQTSGSLRIPEPENPYKGLRAFQQADSDDFFGREVLTLTILKRLQEPVDTSRFLAVVGPSGSGKSSVVKAGVLPELRRGAFPGSENWFLVEMLPGIDPFEELEAALLRIAVNPPESLREQLMTDERGLLRAVKRVLPDDDTELLIFIDQFEELFTLVDEEDIRRHFMDNVLAAVTDPRSRIRVIVTLRADFYDKPLQYNKFGELMRERTEIVLPLNAEELERSITGPAKRANLHLDEGLVTAIVADVNDQPGALPLLQYALTELFERRDGPVLTLEAYNEIGGTLGALARRADELYEGLGEEGQEAARQLFLRLVTLGEGTEDTRRRTLQTELLSIGEDAEEMEMVIDAFGRYRLLTFDNDPSSRTATVEVAHEALIRQWKLLREWLDESRDDLRIQHRLTAQVDDWIKANRDASFLARGTRLQQIESWYETTTLALNDDEEAFLKASIDARKQRDAEEEARRQREEELEKRSRDRLQALVAVMSVAAVIAIGLAIFAFTQSQAAQDARAEAEDNAIAAEQNAITAEENAAQASSLALAANARNSLIQHETTQALALALEANAVYSPTPLEVIRVLASAVYGPGVKARFDTHTGAIRSGDISPDQRLSVTGSSDGTVRLWDNETREELNVIDFGDTLIEEVRFTPDGSQIIVGGTEGLLQAFDVASGEMVTEFVGHTSIVTSIDFNADGSQMLSGSTDQTMRLWDTNTGEEAQQYSGTDSVFFEVALSDDGLIAASSHGDETLADGQPVEAQDRKTRVWDLETGEILHELTIPGTGWVRSVTLSNDGRLVAAASWGGGIGGTIVVWNTETGEEIQQIFGHNNIITGITFFSDAERIVSGSWDRTVRVWDVLTGIEVQRFDVVNDLIMDVAISADDAFVLALTGDIGGNEITRDNESSLDPSAWLIDLQTRAQISTFTGHEDWPWSVDIAPSGDYIVSGSGPLFPDRVEGEYDNTIRVWSTANNEELFQIDPHESTIEAVRFSPDGKIVASGSWDGQVILWDFNAPELEEVRRLTFNEEDVVRVLNVAFSPDGELIAAGGGDGTVVIWRVADGERLIQFGDHTDSIAGIAFSPDGDRVATGSWDSTAALWDVETGEKLTTFDGHQALINDIAYSPNGDTVLTGSWDATVRLWDVETGAELTQLVGHNDRVQSVTYSEDGNLALSGSADTTMRLWSIAESQELFLFPGHTDWVGQVLFMPDGRRALSTAQDNTMRIWRLPSSAEEIIAFAEEERYIRDLTCAERTQYRVEPLCEDTN